MFWPPKFVSNNTVNITDAKYVGDGIGDARFGDHVQSATVLSPWWAWAGVDTPWVESDPMARFILIGEPTHAIRSKNADGVGSVIELGVVHAGLQRWEVVSYFDWYVDDDLGKVGCYAICRLYVPADELVAIEGGDSEFGPRRLDPGTDYLLSVPAGEDRWFYVMSPGPDPYSIVVSGLPGTASVSTYGSPPGALIDDLTAVGNGTSTQTEPSATGPVRYIKVSADPSIDGEVPFNFVLGTPSYLEGGAIDTDATPLDPDTDYALVVRAGATVYYTVPYASPDAYDIDVSGLLGAATIETDGGSPGSLTTDVAAVGDGTHTQTNPSTSGTDRYIKLVGDPYVDSIVAFRFVSSGGGGPTGATCADAITATVGVTNGPYTLNHGDSLWFAIDPSAASIGITLASISAGGITGYLYNGTCSGLSLVNAVSLMSPGSSFLMPYMPPNIVEVRFDTGSPGDTCSFSLTAS